MTPDQHAEAAEELLTTAARYSSGSPYHLGSLAQAQVHATLSLRKPSGARRTGARTEQIEGPPGGGEIGPR